MANLTFDFLHNYVTGERRASDPADAYQYDEGHVLEAVVPVAVTSCEIQYWIRGMEKADAYTPTSITQNTDNTYTILGNIPNSYFETNGDLRVYIVVTDGDASITTYEGYIHIKERQMPEDYVDDDPDNEAVRVIAAARGYAETSEAWAVGQINGEDVPSTADQYQNNASYYAGQAASAASSAAAQASLAPAYDNTATYAVGDYCLHDGRLYECTTAITTAEAWTAAHWTAVTVGGELSNLKDDFHSYHNELGAGYADQIVSSIENEDQTPYNFRKVPYDATLEKVEGIVGVDVVLNQHFKTSAYTETNNGITYTCASDGTITLNGTATANSFSNIGQTIKTFLDHKIYLRGCPSGGGASKYNLRDGYTAGDMYKDIGNGAIIVGKANFIVQIQVTNGITCNDVVFKPQLFDLTAMFGTQIADYVYSLEQSTAGAGVAWLKKHFSKIFDAGYIAYNAGTMVHVSGLSAKKTVGFNQWDEEWELGGISDSTGTNTTNNDRIRSKNYIPVLPNTTYFLQDTVNSRLFYYDESKTFLFAPAVEGVPRTFTTPSNCHYIRFFSVGTTYNHDICINLSDTAKNGTYEPYEAHEYPLDSTIDLHGILKLDSDNNLYADGDVYKPDGTVTRNYTKRAYQSGDESLTNAITDGTNTVVKLSTPTTEQAEPYNPNQICDSNGTEEYISNTVAPVGHVTKYPLDVAERFDNILSMPTADGTYTLRATVNNGKVTYSWVSA